MKILGIDLGSREVKIVLMVDGHIHHKEKMGTMTFYRDYCHYDNGLKVNLDKFNFGPIDHHISTGYGRNNTSLSDFTPINELKAHVYGGMYQTQIKDFILLDIGGQDVKIVKVEKGITVDLALNDKCAASCGRYLENMAQVLELSIDELSTHTDDPINLSATCAVFSESELIGKIAEGIEIPRLCAGVNYSLYNRLKPLLTNFTSDTLIVSGGVAHNKAILKYLKQDYQELLLLAEPQYNGAIGCCAYALNQ